MFPPGNTRITAALAITKSITLMGSGAFVSRIYADNCGGVIVSGGVVDFRMESLEVALAIRYTTTTNALVGIQVNGTTGSRPISHVYRDVYVDGFKTAFMSGYLWSSNFDNFRCDNGLIGMDIYGQSMNNFVFGGSSLNTALVAGSRGIRINGQESISDSTPVANEGWTIHDSFLYQNEVGVELIGVTHCDIHDNIIDFATKQGVLIRDNGTNFGGNCDIHDNYIAMTGATATAAIQVFNAVANVQRMSNRIHDNHCLAYAGATCTVGIYANAAQSQAIIQGNTTRNFGTDIAVVCTGNDILGNHCYSTPGGGGNIYGDPYINHVEGNEGIVYRSAGNPTNYSIDALGRKVWIGTQALTTGTAVQGDRIINCLPAVGSPKGWMCTVAGTPGTWVSEGNL